MLQDYCGGTTAAMGVARYGAAVIVLVVVVQTTIRNTLHAWFYLYPITLPAYRAPYRSRLYFQTSAAFL